MAMALLSSCGENAVKEISGSETLTESEFSSEELDSAVETLEISYSITLISDDNSEFKINSDADLTSYSKRYGKAKIKFPIKITVDGETIIIEDHSKYPRNNWWLYRKRDQNDCSFRVTRADGFPFNPEYLASESYS